MSQNLISTLKHTHAQTKRDFENGQGRQPLHYSLPRHLISNSIDYSSRLQSKNKILFYVRNSFGCNDLAERYYLSHKLLTGTS